MTEWPDRRLLDLFRIEHPILQAPMASAMDAELAIAVAKAGGLGQCREAARAGRAIPIGDGKQAGQSELLYAQATRAQ